MSGTTSHDTELQKLFSKIPQPLKEKVDPRVQKPKVIVIAGPTGVGKTEHSLIVAKALGGEIVSADSMQVHRNMDIGTAKVTKEEMGDIPHHMIDICDINQPFNVVDFYNGAIKAIQMILAKGGVPIVVGGTGFYIHALIYGPPAGPPSVPEVREKLEQEMEEKGTDVLYERLQKMDPDYAKTLTGNDRVKIVRGLEIISLTNKKVSDFPKPDAKEMPYNFRCWFLHKPKEILYPQIEMRCDEMIASGFIDEVKKLLEMGLKENTTASQAIGYRQCIKFLESGAKPEDFDEFIASFKQASRHYAKRQFTWFRKELLFRWLNVDSMPLQRSTDAIIQDYELSF